MNDKLKEDLFSDEETNSMKMIKEGEKENTKENVPMKYARKP
jgi:hypothetical protein